MQSRQQIPYTLCVANHYFYMQCLTTNRYFSTVLSSSTKTMIANSTNNYLQIERSTNKIQEISKENYQSKVDQIAFTHIIKFYVLLGTMVINHQPYLVVATNVSPIAKYLEYPIYLINDVEFVPYRTKTYQRAEDYQEESKVIEELKKNHINKHFYFSYKENITSSLIQQQHHQKDMEIFTEFAWNSHILSQFIRCNINRCWTIPIIQGFIAEIQSTNKYFTYQYLSISRRSIHMSGTRFNSRGLDEQAHSSNFVQTEEIFKCHNEIYVHVSVRGSVPLFWKQVKVRSYIHYSKDKDIDEQAIIKQHYAQLQAKYHTQITTINLLSKEKSPQKELKYRFQALFNRNIKSPYLFFDLNEEMKDNINGQAKVTKFIQSNIKEFFGDSPFLLMQNVTMEIIQHQSVIPRINCLDCLDRTNVLMARISEFFIRAVQKHIRFRGQFIVKKVKNRRILHQRTYQHLDHNWQQDQLNLLWDCKRGQPYHQKGKSYNKNFSWKRHHLTEQIHQCQYN